MVRQSSTKSCKIWNNKFPEKQKLKEKNSFALNKTNKLKVPLAKYMGLKIAFREVELSKYLHPFSSSSKAVVLNLLDFQSC